MQGLHTQNEWAAGRITTKELWNAILRAPATAAGPDGWYPADFRCCSPQMAKRALASGMTRALAAGLVAIPPLRSARVDCEIPQTVPLDAKALRAVHEAPANSIHNRTKRNRNSINKSMIFSIPFSDRCFIDFRRL